MDEQKEVRKTGDCNNYKSRFWVTIDQITYDLQ